MSTSSASLFAARYGALALAVVALHVMADSRLSRAQTFDVQPARAGQADTSRQLADSWRRTVRGWEQLAPDGRGSVGREAPTEHVAFVQLWPAAWAASVILSVLGLAATGAEGKEIDARLAGGDEVGYDLGRAA
jgi:hypothetical protein